MSALDLVFKSRRMGGPFSIKGYARDERERHWLREACGEADREVERIENLLTDFRPSPLNDVNAAAGKAPVTVPSELFELIVRAQALAEESGGVFDITYAAVGMLWRAARAAGCLPDPALLAQALQRVGYREIVLDPSVPAVFLPKAGMRIGLGGVGKGYAVDRAYHVLRARGFVNFMVTAAGDIRVHSHEKAPRPWQIALENPFRAGYAAGGLLIKTGAVATSGDYQRYFMRDGVRYHHVLDARSGHIRQDVASVTIAAPTALTADLYATTIMAMGGTLSRQSPTRCGCRISRQRQI